MAIGVTLLIIAVLIVSIWVIIEIKRLKHKLFAIFLIALILFGYVSFAFVMKGHDLDLKSVPGLIDASKIYMSWLGSAFANMKSVTSYAVKKDWGAEENSSLKVENKNSFLK